MKYVMSAWHCKYLINGIVFYKNNLENLNIATPTICYIARLVRIDRLLEDVVFVMIFKQLTIHYIVGFQR